MAAWNEVADNKGMAGVDDISVRRWERNWEERLANLAADVRANRYKPSQLRLRRIPKKRRGEWRTLRIPTVTDRVLQRAVYHVLSQVYEPVFLDCSFGYRPGRGLREAVQRILNLLLDFGTPVQYSVFECLLDEKDLAKMKKAVKRVIRPKSDRVRFYYLCATCVSKTEVTSGAEVLSSKGETLVV